VLVQTIVTHHLKNTHALKIQGNSFSYSDQTGRFHVRENRGKNYIMILYETTSNHIFAKTMKEKIENSMIKAFETIQEQLTKAGSCPTLHILYNEASKRCKEVVVKQNNSKDQMVSPRMHRRNAANRAISTFKDQLIGRISSADPQFPLT